MYRIVLEKVREDFVTREIVDVNESDFGIIPCGTKNVSTNATEAVQSDANSHEDFLIDVELDLSKTRSPTSRIDGPPPNTHTDAGHGVKRLHALVGGRNRLVWTGI